ncbi:MAG: choice-of-anchor Q domain-containing protein [Gammaproteobacteria bacterium]
MSIASGDGFVRREPDRQRDRDVDRGIADGGVPERDRDGLPRTAGAAVDLGAFEFQP